MTRSSLEFWQVDRDRWNDLAALFEARGGPKTLLVHGVAANAGRGAEQRLSSRNFAASETSGTQQLGESVEFVALGTGSRPVGRGRHDSARSRHPSRHVMRLKLV